MTIRLNIEANSPTEFRKHLVGILGDQVKIDVTSMADLTADPVLPAALGANLQGGIYVGPLVEDGRLVHIIAAASDIGEHAWNEAAAMAEEYADGEFDDWRMPSKNELMLALMNVQDKFEKGYHWSATPYGSRTAWAVDFEDGRVSFGYRDGEFRVRPFRRFTPSSI